MTRFAFDIDGICASTERIMRSKVISKFGVEDAKLHPGEDYNNIYHIDDKTTKDAINDYVKEAFQTDADVYKYADEVKGAWLASHILKPVAYITRRPEDYGIKDATVSWLSENFFFPAPVFFIPKGTCKSVKAKGLNIDYLVEDSPHEIVSCRDNGLKTLVMEYHYNEAIRTPDTLSFPDWKSILKWWEENERYKLKWS